MAKQNKSDEFFDKHVDAYSKRAGAEKDAAEKGKEPLGFIPKANLGTLTHKLEFPILSKKGGK